MEDDELMRQAVNSAWNRPIEVPAFAQEGDRDPQPAQPFGKVAPPSETEPPRTTEQQQQAGRTRSRFRSALSAYWRASVVMVFGVVLVGQNLALRQELIRVRSRIEFSLGEGSKASDRSQGELLELIRAVADDAVAIRESIDGHSPAGMRRFRSRISKPIRVQLEETETRIDEIATRLGL